MSEADPAALLFQFVAGFGNIVGRDAYMMADGAQHGLNLFGVLVGQSSKGRKGTSWNQIARPAVGQVDEEWRKLLREIRPDTAAKASSGMCAIRSPPRSQTETATGGSRGSKKRSYGLRSHAG